MEKSDFDRLMERYVAGQVSVSERARIEAWLDAMGHDDNTDLELSKEEEERIFSKLSSNLISAEDLAALKPKKMVRPEQWIIRMAASLLIISILSYTIWYFGVARQSRQEVAAVEEVEKIILEDGSLVWLRGEASELRYQESPDGEARMSTFHGEALFEVAKDAERPFVVQCGDASVRVVGTSFSLRATNELVEVTVLTGKVNLSSPLNPEGIDLLPHEKGVYRPNGTFEKGLPDQREIVSLTENTDYDMRFANTSMDEVFRRLEGKFNVAISLSDAAVGDCRITIDLTDKSLENSLRLISEVLNLRYSTGDTVVVTGTGCH